MMKPKDDKAKNGGFTWIYTSIQQASESWEKMVDILWEILMYLHFPQKKTEGFLRSGSDQQISESGLSNQSRSRNMAGFTGKHIESYNLPSSKLWLMVIFNYNLLNIPLN